MKINIIHIVPGLKMGGAEKALLRLIINSPNYNHSVLSLTRGGAMYDIFLKNKIKVTVFDFDKSFFSSFKKMIIHLSSEDVDVVQTWLYSANIIGGIAAKISKVNNIIWGLRGTGIPQSFFSLQMSMIFFGAFLSYFVPNKIVSNAKSVRKFHTNKGYKKNEHIVIYNGFDVSLYQSKQSFSELKMSLGINDNSLIIGTVGRYDKLKDFRTMIKAISRVMHLNKNIRFIMVGRDLSVSNNELLKEFISNKVDLKRVSLVGEVIDVIPYLGLMDIFCLSSKKEGFPNVVCEAMLMAIPSVVTDAGDSSEILSDTGMIVPIKDFQKLTDALMKMVSLDDKTRTNYGHNAHLRASQYFSIEENVNKFSELYSKRELSE